MNSSRVQRAGAACRVLGVVVVATVLSAHVGSPDVFFAGKAGAYGVRVVVRPPMVVPGIARVTVRAPANVTGVSIRPVFWRAGSKGAPSADEMRQLAGAAGTFDGSLWLMNRGAYSVDVIVTGDQGTANVLVPVASVATGRLGLSPALGALLAALGVFLIVGLVNIVYKGAGESLVAPGQAMSTAPTRTARVAGAVAFGVLVAAVFGGARWWGAVDRDYQSTIYEPSPLSVVLTGGQLRVAATDTFYQTGRVSAYIPDHGKLMHLFLVRADDARGFAHLHPKPVDTSAVPAFTTPVPALPAGTYHVFGDVVHETGFERTMVGSVQIPDKATPSGRADPDDGWFAGAASPNDSTRLADGTIMWLKRGPPVPTAGEELTLAVTVSDAAGRPVTLEPYLGMPAHAVVARLDGAVYVHLHPMGTVTMAAQDAFAARDRGDTTAEGRLIAGGHAEHQASADKSAGSASSMLLFPYAFPKGGDYRLFVQVKRNGRVLTGAFAVTVADSVARAQ